MKKQKLFSFIFFRCFFYTEDDFIFDDDLYMACLILQKQIKYIDGKKENIVIPSIKMEQIREQNGEFLEKIPTRSLTITSIE